MQDEVQYEVRIVLCLTSYYEQNIFQGIALRPRRGRSEEDAFIVYRTLALHPLTFTLRSFH